MLLGNRSSRTTRWPTSPLARSSAVSSGRVRVAAAVRCQVLRRHFRCLATAVERGCTDRRHRAVPVMGHRPGEAWTPPMHSCRIPTCRPPCADWSSRDVPGSSAHCAPAPSTSAKTAAKDRVCTATRRCPCAVWGRSRCMLSRWQSVEVAGRVLPVSGSVEWISPKRPHRRTVGLAQGGLERLRVLRGDRPPAAEGLCHGDLPRRAIHRGQRRARLRFVQYEQVQ